jgi:hypothetical protein
MPGAVHRYVVERSASKFWRVGHSLACLIRMSPSMHKRPGLINFLSDDMVDLGVFGSARREGAGGSTIHVVWNAMNFHIVKSLPQESQRDSLCHATEIRHNIVISQQA